ncbi:MFS transporter [Mechercharimyces sp. CAU 1602]|uniref:MFS transporter n=1 Tax=Mechercharimyces sp. CAU 1602 TaxID=2973933 RepID=UPI002161D2F5|nr:MFS transporter [Mechercharimyces sp. CAU 1602]MCS1350612.1 MFS transporter [Mechercharimyces sp. CAU 1602]
MKEQRSLAMETYIIAFFISALDLSMMAPLLSYLQRVFLLPVEWGAWLIALHLAVFTVSLPLMEMGSSLIGRKKWFILSLCWFSVGSLLAASSNSWLLLLCGRLLQAVGAGGFVPLFSESFNRVMVQSASWIRNVLTGSFIVIMIVSPWVSSMILMWLGWRTVFLFYFAAAVFMMLIFPRYINDNVPEEKKSLPYDSLSLFFLLLLALMTAVTRADLRDFPHSFLDPMVLPYWIIGLGLFLPLYMMERISPRPLFRGHFAKDPNMIITHVVVILTGMSWIAVVYLPGWAMLIWDEVGAGWLSLSIVAASVWVIIPFVQHLSTRFGYTLVLLLGFLLGSISYFTLSVVQEWPLGLISLILLGISMGMTMGAPIHRGIFMNVKAKDGKNVRLSLDMFRAMGGALGLLLLANVIGRGAFAGTFFFRYQNGWTFQAVICLLGLFLSMLLYSSEDGIEEKWDDSQQ